MTTITTGDVIARLRERGLELAPAPPPPAGLYEPFRLHRGTGYLAAQVPGYNGVFGGRVGAELTLEQGQAAAQSAAVHALTRLHEALGGFERLEGLLHIAGHVASTMGFREQPEVLNGASELFLYALGERGKHSRTAYAPLQLPRNVSIELEITFAYREARVGTEDK